MTDVLLYCGSSPKPSAKSCPTATLGVAAGTGAATVPAAAFRAAERPDWRSHAERGNEGYPTG
jgi:hypothetical protein